MSDLDLSQYDLAVQDHALMGRARAHMFDTSGTWSVALDRGELTLGDRVHHVQILGTYSGDTFMWAWANPGAAGWASSLAMATWLRKRGDEPGNAVFREPKVAAKWVKPYELAWVCGELAGGFPVFAANVGSAIAMLVVTDVKLDVTQLSTAAIPGLVLDMMTFIFGEAPTAVAVFLRGLGFAVEQRPSAVSAQRGATTFEVHFDDQDRPFKFSGSL